MAKAKAKARARKRANRPKVRSGNNALRQKIVHEIAKAACSISNPFCDEAFHAKLPDGTIAKSTTWSLDRDFPASTDANQNLAWLWCPNWGGVGANGTVTGTTAAYGAIVQNSTQFPSGVQRYRIVSWGIEIRSVVAPLEASGMVRVRLFSPLSGASLASIDTTSRLADDSYDFSLADRKSHFIIPKRMGTFSELYSDATAATTVLADWQNPGFQCVQVSVTGGPTSKPAINMRVVMHYEIVFSDGDSQNYFATPSPVKNQTVLDTGSGIVHSIGSFFEGTASALDNLAQSKAVKYLGGIAGYITGGPAGAVSGFGAVKALQDG